MNSGILSGFDDGITPFVRKTGSIRDNSLYSIVPTGDFYFNYNSLLLLGNAANGSQNNTFLDSSSNNFTITKNGNVSQGAYSPYGTNWSGFFSGASTNTGISLPSSSAFQFGTGDFCIEAWVSCTSLGVYFFNTCANFSSAGGLSLLIDSSGNLGLFSFNSNSVVLLGSGNSVQLGVWTHVAVSRSGTTLRAFVNGSQVGSTTNSENFLGTSSQGGIGAWASNPAAPFIGYMSNLRVVKGSAVYTGSYTVPTGPLTAITNTVLLTLQSNRIIDNSSNGFSLGNINTTNTVGVQRFNPFNLDGVTGGSGYFDGTGDYLSTSGTSSFNPSTGSWTFEAWCYFTSSSNTDYLVTGLTSGTASFYIAWAGTTFYVGDGVTNNINGIASSKPVNQWFHVAVVKNGSTYTAYINGSSIASSTTALASSTTTTFEIGARSPASQFSIGYISNFRYSQSAVYTTAFTPPASPVTGGALLLNFTNAGIIDNAMMTDIETVGNAQISTTQSKFGGSAIFLDGNGDYLSVSNNTNFGFGTGDFTIEMWFYRTAAQAGGEILYCARPQTTQGLYPVIWINNNFLRYFNNSSDRIVGTTTISNNVWYHMALSRRGSSTRLFLNGVQEGSTYTDTSNYPIPPAGRPFIGYTGYILPGYEFTGYLDNIRVTSGVARYTSNFAPPSQELYTTKSDFAVQYLVVGGGGGGGGGATSSAGGYTGGPGGGAGGLLTGYYTLENIVIGTAYTVTVGAGGSAGGIASGTGVDNSGASGSNSVFALTTATGGGGAGHGAGPSGYGPASNQIGKNGGSGGGSGYRSTSAGTGISGQGFGGGNAGTGEEGSGGGGGAGAAGSNGSISPAQYTGGAGGAGVSSTISGASVTYAGGGGAGGLGLAGYDGRGGAGGSGGGGAGSGQTGNYNATATAGTVNCGGGGGGGARVIDSSTPGGGAAGGSGVVILRIPSNYNATFSVGLTSSLSTSVPGFKIYTVTAGSGTVTFSR